MSLSFSLDTRDFSRRRIQSLSLQGNGRCNWKKIDAKGTGPDEESNSSEVRTINTCSLRAAPFLLLPTLSSFYSVSRLSPLYRARLSVEPRGVILYTSSSSSSRRSGFVAQVALTYLSGSSFLCFYENFLAASSSSIIVDQPRHHTRCCI